MISPDTAPFGMRFAQWAMASRKSRWPIIFSLPGQMSANHFGFQNSRQKDR